MKLNRSAARVVDILELIADSEKALGITEISNSLDIPKSSTFDIVYTLVEKGFLEVADERLRTFRLGLKIFTIGAAFLRKGSLIQIARPYLEKVMQETQDTVFLAVENNGEMVYLDKVEAVTHGIKPTATLGSTNPMSITALGRAILSTYTPEKVKEIVGEDPLVTKTKYSINNYTDLIKELEATRERGYAVDGRESQEEICCVAAPIYDYSNKVIAAISIASLAYRMNEDRQKELGRIIVTTAMEISSRLGYVGKKLF